MPGRVPPPFLGSTFLMPHCCSYYSSSNQSLVITTSLQIFCTDTQFHATVTNCTQFIATLKSEMKQGLEGQKLGPKDGATLQTTECMLFLCNCCIYSNLSYHPPNCFFHRRWSSINQPCSLTIQLVLGWSIRITNHPTMQCFT